ncbi:MAG: AAA family ATPase [Planctomycetota bacterium]|nr:MAG: AAA family ATPase [Planctomycetota bacterium]
MGEEVSDYVRARVPLLYLVTWEEERVLRELEAVAVRLRKRCLVWTETDGLRNVALPNEAVARRAREPAEVLGTIRRDDADALYILVDFHLHVEKAGVRRLLRDLAHELQTSTKTVLLVAPRLVLPAELEKEVTVVDVPLPSRAAIARHLDLVGERLGPGKSSLSAGDRDELIRSAQGMTLQELEQSLALAMVKLGVIDRRAIELVLREKEQLVRKGSALECVRWDEGFESVGGLDLLKDWLASRKDAFSQEARNYGLPAPRGLCLIGVQGCGKSLSAKAVARFYRLPLLRFDIGRVFAGIVGRSEENVRQALRLAESIAPCVLWIDELEKSLSGARSSSVSDAGTTARVISTITTWLQERGGEGVYVVATANDISNLPPELLRKGRFDEIFFVDLPAEPERAEILSIHLRKRDREPDDFDLARVAAATRGFSGAELEEAVIAGLYEAFSARRAMTTEDLLAAVERTVPLSTTMQESVGAIRAWAKGRARRASSAS